ncbi:MAG: FAD-binding oxidoreductase [Deltaproteobacteria bacterium]|nr:FAD-binding oxidoreductase [Deltaproteobacteria bacterium]
MEYAKLTKQNIKDLESMVEPERFSTGESNLDLHAKDQSQHTPTRPEAVIWPISRAEVSNILKYANEHTIPVTGWGAGSSLEGNPIPVRRGLVLDFSKMNRILEIRESDFQADVEPGVIYRDLNERLRHRGLFFPPDPGANATIGGMIANNASGTRTVRYGSTRANILRLSAVLASGETIETGSRSSKTSSGYDLINLFVGSEGTLGIVVEATVRLTGMPEEFSSATATFPSVEEAGKAVFEMIRAGLDPASLELLAPECITLINKEKKLGLEVLPTLFLEFHGPSQKQLTEIMEIASDICGDTGCHDFRTGIERKERDDFLKARHELGEMITRNHPGRSHMAIDVAVPISAYPEIIALAREESRKADIPGYTFSHAGDGNLHLVFMGKTGDEKEWAVIDQVNARMVEKALAMGGTATGEHGVGIGKRKFMQAEHGNSLEWMKRIKDLFDPKGILNPGKIFP